MEEHDMEGHDDSVVQYGGRQSHLHNQYTDVVSDAGGAMHVVNSIDLLDPGTFKPAEDEFIEAGNTNLQKIRVWC